MALHNRVSADLLKERLAAETFNRVTISFYQYAKITDPQLFRDQLYQGLFDLAVFGRIYVAHEGINAQISVPEHNVDAFRTFLYSFDFLNGIRLNIAVDDNGKSFYVLKIKVREKIVADGIEDPSFDITHRGQYLDAAAFNELSAKPDTVIVDMRNHYEFEVGHFENALEVPSDTFREQLPMAVDMLKDQKDKNIIMYCTGGIRCEKASAYFLHNGFNNVFHLEGGIIEYSNKAKEHGLPNKFKGKNFVFDDRLGERIGEEIISKCHQCGEPCDDHTNCANDGCHLLFIQCKKCAEKFQGTCSDECQHVYNLPEEEQALLRQNIDKGHHVFNKSKQRLRPRLGDR
ncbi:rhodanese-related sulfurtransferase [Chitinophaga horti]|uniref:tRNA uridine(34) hydroxylase n=1 Tax=Chitinophaga horti TaxID=2920382 RepID=A0ABY6JA96_9BACT|nr:rhodanese-related sulfurtransferase [Chitinophaga horti]UYQ95216.1 rhodanese-related sulfurtransferase [Chitinophaga horti]